MAQAQTSHPVQFSVDYPDRPLNRLTTFFRLVMVIPIMIVGSLVGAGLANWSWGLSAGLFFPPMVMILFRRKYPRWWFDFNLALLKFSNRVSVYVFMLRDEYPSTDEEQAVHLEMPYPDVERDLNRWLPLVKWLFAVPHYIVFAFLTIALIGALIGAWFAILFTGRYPRGLFDFVVGVARWYNRVWAYAFILVTDRYPPFRLSA